MAAPCLGHQCMEREYRATNVKGTVKNKAGQQCPSDDAIIKSITDGWATDAFEDEHCDPNKCRCTLGAWPAVWTLLEKNVAYAAAWTDMLCKADVTITYDWECRERAAPCYRKAPTTGKG
jgi:hypothetical protein